MKKFYIAALFLSFFTSLSLANYDGNDLLSFARGYEKIIRGEGEANDGMDCGMYMGYIAGAVDALLTAKKVSIPDRVTLKQHCMILKKYLESNPEYLHLPGDVLVEIALNRAFPKPKLDPNKKYIFGEPTVDRKKMIKELEEEKRGIENLLKQLKE